MALHEERARFIDTKEFMSTQIDDLMKKDLRGAQVVRELECKYYETVERLENLQNENERLREDYSKSREEVRILEMRYEDKIKNLEYQLNEQENNERLMMEKILTEHNVNVKELNKEWESRLDEVESKMRGALSAKEDIEIELQKVLDSVDIIKQEHALEIKEIIERIKDEEYHTYESKLTALFARIEVLESARDEFRRDNCEFTRYGQSKEVKLQETIITLQSETTKLRAENASLLSKVEEQSQIIEKLKAEIVSKDLKAGGILTENNELHMLLNKKKESYALEIDMLLKEHKKDRNDWEYLRESIDLLILSST